MKGLAAAKHSKNNDLLVKLRPREESNARPFSYIIPTGTTTPYLSYISYDYTFQVLDSGCKTCLKQCKIAYVFKSELKCIKIRKYNVLQLFLLKYCIYMIAAISSKTYRFSTGVVKLAFLPFPYGTP